MDRKVLVIVLLTLQAMVAVYVASVVYLLSVWMMGDSAAFQMVGRDWVRVGFGRLVYGTGVAGVLGVLVWGVNRLLLPRLGGAREWSSRIAALAFGVVVLGAVVGALQFMIQRPFL